MSERVLHVALRTPFEQQPALARALASLGEYAEVDWDALGAMAPSAILEKVRQFKPSIVFLQIQRSGAFDDLHVREWRAAGDPRAVFINWDGDQHCEPSSPERRWFVALGRACDASLVVNAKHPAEYAALGVRNPGYLQIGVDETIYRPTTPTPGTPAIVMLASKYFTHAPRNGIVQSLAERYGRDFAVYGHGWEGPCARPMLRQDEEAGVYAAAECAISMSIRNDLPCYTSDRLFRAMGSGAVTLVEAFPGMADLGLFDEACCLAWTGFDSLCQRIDWVLSCPGDFTDIRKAATELVHTRHTWQARMPELLEIVRSVRAQWAA